MTDLLARVQATGLLAPGTHVLVLLSGGRDSTCLLDMAVELGCRVRALHVDYGLRPDSGADADHCRALSGRLGVALSVQRATRPGDAPGNLQAWARDVRYAAAARLAAGARIAAGHTATDQAETILYRLATSPGRRALLGMQPRSGHLIRPLLGLTRAETAQWCLGRGLAWREDPTNSTSQFARGRVREGLLPALLAVDDRAEQAIVRTAELLRDEAEVLDAVVETALAGRDRIAIDHLAALPRALARLIVRRLAEDAIGASCPRAAGRLDELLALGDGSLDVGEGARAVVADAVLRFAATPSLGARP